MKAHTSKSEKLHLLQHTAQHFLHNNQQAYLTGGSIRNLLLGEPCNDWDILEHSLESVVTLEQLATSFQHNNVDRGEVSAS